MVLILNKILKDKVQVDQIKELKLSRQGKCFLPSSTTGAKFSVRLLLSSTTFKVSLQSSLSDLASGPQRTLKSFKAFSTGTKINSSP